MTIADPKREPFVNPPRVERRTPEDPAKGTGEPGTPPFDAADDEEAHEGATEDQVGDRTGPGAGYDEMAGRKPDRRE